MHPRILERRAKVQQFRSEVVLLKTAQAADMIARVRQALANYDAAYSALSDDKFEDEIRELDCFINELTFGPIDCFRLTEISDRLAGFAKIVREMADDFGSLADQTEIETAPLQPQRRP